MRQLDPGAVVARIGPVTGSGSAANKCPDRLPVTYLNHPVQTRSLHTYLRWSTTNARHRDILAAERKERGHIRSETGIRWGGRSLEIAA